MLAVTDVSSRDILLTTQQKRILESKTGFKEKESPTQERKHIGPLNCPHFHYAAAKLTEEELQLPPSIMKMPRRSAESY